VTSCGAAAAVPQRSTATMSIVGYVIPACSYHFVIAVWRTKEAMLSVDFYEHTADFNEPQASHLQQKAVTG
jgi:hypothetical protein